MALNKSCIIIIIIIIIIKTTSWILQRQEYK